MGIEIPDADPDGLTALMRGYSRCEEVIHPLDWEEMGWESKREGQLNVVTNTDNITRVMKDLYGSLNVVQYGYTVTQVREIRSPFQRDIPFTERDYVYRVVMEPLAKFLVYSQYGYHGFNGFHEQKAPTKP